jgi:hypothetical protein
MLTAHASANLASIAHVSRNYSHAQALHAEFVSYIAFDMHDVRAGLRVFGPCSLSNSGS